MEISLLMPVNTPLTPTTISNVQPLPDRALPDAAPSVETAPLLVSLATMSTKIITLIPPNTPTQAP